jgi:hypothetical protein
MNTAIDQGDAAPLSRSHGWLAHYLDAWWIEYEGGWLRVIDDAATRELDQVARRVAEATALTAVSSAQRASGERNHASPSDRP